VALCFPLLSIGESANRCLMVMDWAQDHHVCRFVFRTLRERDDVVILEKWVSATAASEATFLPKLPS
jgi:hypothetical protein